MHAMHKDDRKVYRIMNKKLQTAIDERKPLRWEFGEYRKYYTGIMLIAFTGYAETGHIYDHVVYGTLSLTKATEMCEILNSLGVKHTGWVDAVEKLKDKLSSRYL